MVRPGDELGPRAILVPLAYSRQMWRSPFEGAAYSDTSRCGENKRIIPSLKGRFESVGVLLKHKLLTTFDDVLKDIGCAVKDVHEMSIDLKNPQRSSWDQQHDQLMALLTLAIAARSKASETLMKGIS